LHKNSTAWLEKARLKASENLMLNYVQNGAVMAWLEQKKTGA
jgi:hypothetical protein